MKNTVTLSIALIATCILNSANAGVPEKLHYMVSPASCQPISSEDANELNFINGVWRLDSNATTVAAYLACPVDFYGSTGRIHNLQLWYKSKGNDSYNQVRAQLKSRQKTSSGVDVMATITTKDANTHGTAYRALNNFISGDAGPHSNRNYYVEVTLSRNNYQSPGDVAFVGLAIDIQ